MILFHIQRLISFRRKMDVKPIEAVAFETVSMFVHPVVSSQAEPEIAVINRKDYRKMLRIYGSVTDHDSKPMAIFSNDHVAVPSQMAPMFYE